MTDAEIDTEEYDDFEQSVYEELSELRWKLIELLNNEQVPLSLRCRNILDAVDSFQNQLDETESVYHEVVSVKSFFRFMESWEFTNEDFPAILKAADYSLFMSEAAEEIARFLYGKFKEVNFSHPSNIESIFSKFSQ